MGIVRDHRSSGIGRTLLRAIMETARSNQVECLSLSVDPGNYARHLYESEGFVKVGESGTSWTMLRHVKLTNR